MPSVTQQLPALIGVVIGAGLLSGRHRTQRAQWRREQSSRWDWERAPTYGEYSHAIKRLYINTLRIASSRMHGDTSDSIDYDEDLAQDGRPPEAGVVVPPIAGQHAGVDERGAGQSAGMARGPRQGPRAAEVVRDDMRAGDAELIELSRQVSGVAVH